MLINADYCMQVVRNPLLSNQVNLSRALVAGLRVRWSFGRERSIRCPDASGESSRLGRQQPTSSGGWTTTAAMSSIRRRAKVQRYRYAFVCTSGDKKNTMVWFNSSPSSSESERGKGCRMASTSKRFSSSRYIDLGAHCLTASFHVSM